MFRRLKRILSSKSFIKPLKSRGGARWDSFSFSIAHMISVFEISWKPSLLNLDIAY